MSHPPEGEPRPRDPRALLSAGGLLLVVAAVLILGAVLHGRVPSPGPVQSDLPAPPPPADVLHEDLAAPAPADLEARARSDRARLPAEGDRWTLQLVVACNEEGVRGLLARAGDDAHLFVLPRPVAGRPCWAVTWGSFPSRSEALAATPPPALRLDDPPQPRPLAGYLP